MSLKSTDGSRPIQQTADTPDSPDVETTGQEDDGPKHGGADSLSRDQAERHSAAKAYFTNQMGGRRDTALSAHRKVTDDPKASPETKGDPALSADRQAPTYPKAPTHKPGDPALSANRKAQDQQKASPEKKGDPAFSAERKAPNDPKVPPEKLGDPAFSVNRKVQDPPKAPPDPSCDPAIHFRLPPPPPRRTVAQPAPEKTAKDAPAGPPAEIATSARAAQAAGTGWFAAAGTGTTETKQADYPVSEDAIKSESRVAGNMKDGLPQWSMNDKRFFLQRWEPGNVLKLEQPLKLIIPSDAEIAAHPMVSLFDENNKTAESNFNDAQAMFSYAGDFLKAGDKDSAQQYFDAGLALKKSGSLAANRNEQWVQLRSSHVDQAMAKHEDDLKDFGLASVSALGADAAAGEQAFKLLGKCYGALKGGAITISQGAADMERVAQMRSFAAKAGKDPAELAAGSLSKMNFPAQTLAEENAQRISEFHDLLSHPENLAKTDPEELFVLSGRALTKPECEQLIKTAQNLPQFRIAESQVLTQNALRQLEFAHPEDMEAAAAKAILSNDEKLVNANPAQLARMTHTTPEEAAKMISGADLRVNRQLDQMSWSKALDRLRQKAATGDEAAAKTYGEMDAFMRGQAAHQSMMKEYSQAVKGILADRRAMSPEQLQKTYGLSPEDAQVLKEQLAKLPDNFSFAAHDLYGPAAKNQTSIARLLGRSAKKGEDAALDFAVHRHNVQFDHHNPRDPLSCLESALDRVDAMRDTLRAYRNFKPVPWEGIQSGTSKMESQSERVWNSFAQTEVKRWEEAGFIERTPHLGPAPPVFQPGN